MGIWADEAQKLIQHDQIACLNDLKARIIEAVEHIHRREMIACSDFSKAKFISSLTSFGVGALSPIGGSHKDSISTGMKLAKPVLDEKALLDATLITVGKGGIPSIVGVTQVSSLARQSHINDPQVRGRLQRGGCLFMTREQFVRVLSKVKSRLFDGPVSLPVPVEPLAKKCVNASESKSPPLIAYCS